MDDDLQNFEAELKRLQPAQPSRTLVDDIDRQLSAPPSHRSSAKIHWIWFATLPAAAAWAILLSLSRPVKIPAGTNGGAVISSAKPNSEETLKPVTAENVLYSARD